MIELSYQRSAMIAQMLTDKGANEIMNKEFKVENHVAGTSVKGFVTFSIFNNSKVLSDNDKYPAV